MRSYKRIAAVKTTIDIIRHLADRREPASGADVASGMSLQYGTVMCHLTTLEDSGMVRRIGDHFELGDGMALLWARKKSQLQAQRDCINNTLSAIGE